MISGSFSGSTVLVTGCRRGIGEAISIAFADAGADVIGVSANLEPDGGAVGSEIAQRGRIFRGHTTDFGDRAALYDLVEALLAGQEQRRHRAEVSSETTAEKTSTVALSLKNLTDREGAFTDVSFEVAPGEIVAIGGVGGSGKYSVGEAVAGLRKSSSGAVTVNGATVTPGNVKASQRAGIGFVPADRHRDGYVGQLSVAENMTMGVMDRLIYTA